jgi:flagellar biosynthesis/type III secretory pathway protein FliH
MALISQADSEVLVREAVVLDLGDLRAQAGRIIEQARQEAAAIIEDARRERDRLIEGASEKGHSEGRAAGHAEGRDAGVEEGRAAALEQCDERLSHVCASLQEGLDAFRVLRDQMLEEGRDDVLTFAISVAEQVARRTIDLDREAALRQCEAALAIVLRPSALVIAAHPEDLAILQDAAPSLLARFANAPDVRFVADDSLSRGSALVRTDRGVVEADVDAQIARIVECVRPSATPEPTDGAGLP